jgi:TfoX/Sxy family transcriptional regulator of competence genes
MAYDEDLATRVREVLKRTRGITEKKMFGGLAFMLDGKMCCGIVKNDLMVRIGPNHYESALAERHVRPMDFTGRPLRGMVFVASAGLRQDTQLRGWIDRAKRFVRTLPDRD